jgi:hypothetical protein
MSIAELPQPLQNMVRAHQRLLHISLMMAYVILMMVLFIGFVDDVVYSAWLMTLMAFASGYLIGTSFRRKNELEGCLRVALIHLRFVREIEHAWKTKARD